VTSIARGLQLVVDAAQQLGCPDIDRVLVVEPPRCVTGKREEPIDLARQVREWELEHFALGGVQVDDRHPGEVARDDESRQLLVREGVEVVERLVDRLAEVLSSALVLGQQHARPNHVYEAGAASRRASRVALERSAHPSTLDTEEGEEVRPE
jgi:hypothetical protein